MATISPTQGLLDSSGNPVPRTFDEFYKPATPTAGYDPSTVFDPTGKALDYKTFVSEGGKPDFSNVKSVPSVAAGKPVSTGTPPPTPAPGATGTPGPNQNLDPLTAMNKSIAGMLTDAQAGTMAINQNAMKGNAQINTAAATSDMGSTLNTGVPVAGLSPSQQDQARSAEGKVFSTAGTNFNDQIQYFSKNISDLENSLGKFSDLASISLQANLTPEAIQGVLAAYASGDTSALNSLPASARAQVYAALAANPTITQMYEANTKKGVVGSPSTGVYQPAYDANGNLMRDSNGQPVYTQVIAPTNPRDLSRTGTPTTTNPTPATGPGTPSGGGGGGPTTKLSLTAARTKYDLPPNLTESQWNEIQSSVQNAISSAGGVTDDNRYTLWGVIADSMKQEQLDPSRFDAYLWDLFHPGGLTAYKQNHPTSASAAAKSSAADLINKAMQP